MGGGDAGLGVALAEGGSPGGPGGTYTEVIPSGSDLPPLLEPARGARGRERERREPGRGRGQGGQSGAGVPPPRSRAAAMSRAARAPPSVPVPVPAMRRAGDTHTRHVPPTHEGGGTCWHPLAPSRGTQPGHPAGDPHPTPRVGGHTHPDTLPALQLECPHVGTRGHPTMGWGWQLSPSLMPPPAPCLQLPCSSCAPPTPPKPPAQQLQPWRWRGGRHRTLLLPPVGCHPSRMSPSPGHHGMTSSPTPPPSTPPN